MARRWQYPRLAWVPHLVTPSIPRGWNAQQKEPCRVSTLNTTSLAWVPQPITPPNSFAFVPLSDEPTIAWNIGNLEVANAMVTISGNRTLNLTGALSGGSYILIIEQDSVGSWTLTLPGSWRFEGGGGLVLSTAPGAIDLLAFTFDGTNYYATLGQSYS